MIVFGGAGLDSEDRSVNLNDLHVLDTERFVWSVPITTGWVAVRRRFRRRFRRGRRLYCRLRRYSCCAARSRHPTHIDPLPAPPLQTLPPLAYAYACPCPVCGALTEPCRRSGATTPPPSSMGAF